MAFAAVVRTLTLTLTLTLALTLALALALTLTLTRCPTGLGVRRGLQSPHAR